MTDEEAKKMLKAKLECFKNETSGINYDCNMRLCDGCSLNYEQGNMGEQKEALETAIKALEEKPCETIKEIPKDYKYDTETEDFLVYRHKYTGHEIHIEKPVPRYRLEQQPCEDCISRQAVIDAIDNIDWYHISNKGELVQGANKQTMPLYKAADIFYAIDALPSVTPQQTRWIPVSERLPEDYIHVLCQFTLNGMGECYLAHGAFHVVGGLVMTCNEVIAWMPLPQPYKAESEDKE